MQRQMDFTGLRRWASQVSSCTPNRPRPAGPVASGLRSLTALLLLSCLTSFAFAQAPSSPTGDGDKAAALVEPHGSQPAQNLEDETGSIGDKAPADTDPSHASTETPAEPSAQQPEPGSPSKSADTPAAAPQQAVAEVKTPAALLEEALFGLVSGVKAPQAAEKEKTYESLAAFYTLRNFETVWSQAGQPTVAARAVIERLQHASDDGLDVMPVPDLLAGNDADRVNADLALSEAVIRYAREAEGGRVDPKAISPFIGERPDLTEPLEVLTSVTTAGEKAGNVLWAFNPPQKPYQALRDKLAELRRQNLPVAQRIPSGPDLSVGMRDPRVSLIRSRFGLDGRPASPAGELIYDTKVAAAVADFQKSKGLPVSGILTARTIAALSGGQPSRLENEIIANMERWRWLPRDLGETHIAVNIPDFSVALIHDDQVITRHRVVVGKPDTPTPVFSNAMKYLIVNPYWNVPQSIIKKEFMAKSGGDLSYLSAHGYEVSSRNGHPVVRQPPGEKNALGQIKFLFPNDYAVYLHDTPSKQLFASANRALSHGCVRVQEPFSFAADILGQKWSETRLKSMIGPQERYINLPTPLPIHLEYFTTYVDETGRLQLRDDVYGYSHKVKVGLGLEH